MGNESSTVASSQDIRESEELKVTKRSILEYLANQGADYADIRAVDEESQALAVQNGKVTLLNTSQTEGFGVRVLVDGAWGFYGAKGSLEAGIGLKVAGQALSIAKAGARVSKGKPVELAPVQSFDDTWVSPCKIDPFQVKLEDKINLLQEAHRLMTKNPVVRSTHGSMTFFRKKTEFLSTERVSFSQTVTESGGSISAVAVGDGDVQSRSCPNNVLQAGYEAINDMELLNHAEEIASQAAGLTKAPSCPSMVSDVILMPSHLRIQIHESCGHAFELDRVQGAEKGYYGGSFLPLNGLGSYRYGSPQCNLTADATVPRGLGTFKYDDEGIPGQRFHLVKDGIAVGYLASRETAGDIGLSRSNGTMRAEDWSQAPIIRMTNINLEPGDWTLDEIIQDTKHGILMDTSKSWSIDDRRWNFQMGSEIGWLIKDGSIEGIVKNPTYTGVTSQFWGSLDAVAGKDEWEVCGSTGCGKGEPIQNIHVSHGSSPARFRSIKVGV